MAENRPRPQILPAAIHVHEAQDMAEDVKPLPPPAPPTSISNPPPPSPSPSDADADAETTSGTSRRPTEEPTSSSTFASTSTSSPAPTLSANPDYLALQSSLVLLNAQHRTAVKDMQTLVRLKEKALANPNWFKHVLLNGEFGKMVPGKQNVVKCPRVEWERYGLGARLGKEIEKPAPVEAFYTVN